jgi:predicted DNA-binding transcriptional regulator
MGLVTATSFQHSPCIQARTFAVIGVLATGDVDDDLLYQMLVAFKQGLAQSDESRTAAVVSMLRCITQVVPLLPRDSRYLAQLFWLGFALVQSSALPFYEEATRLMQQALETLDRHGTFDNRSVSQVLVEARMALGDVPDQLDAMLGLYFHYLPATSFSIAAPIFKGIQVESLQKSAKSILRCLLRIATTSAVKRRAVGAEDSQGMTPVAESTRTVDLDALGYFLALLPSLNCLKRGLMSSVVLSRTRCQGSTSSFSGCKNGIGRLQ